LIRPEATALTAFDTLFWLLMLMLGVTAYAIEAGLAVRHRKAVLTTMFSIVAAVLYIMIIGEDSSFGRAGATPGIDAAAPAIALPKMGTVEGGDLTGLKVPPILQTAAAEQPERKVPTGPFNDCEGCPSMIAIPEGSYTMGSPPAEVGRRDTEAQMSITLTYPFATGRFEISRDQFALFVEDARHQITSGCLVNGRYSGSANWQRPGFEQAGNHPVVCVSWRDAKAYVAWLSKKSQKKYRLLSEAEWEYMARGGSTTAFIQGDTLLPSHGNFNRVRDGTIPIGFSAPNRFGVHDVHGNVWEILDDCWNPELGFNSLDGRATILRGDCSQRVIRGGGWDSTAPQARLAARAFVESNAAANTVGFRIARTFD
jgi:formylglycine-generating enzyme required for sulfatase activity